MKQISVIVVLQAIVPDDANLEEIQEMVDDYLNYNEPDFRLGEIKTKDEDADSDIKEPWFQFRNAYVAEGYQISINN